MWSLERTPSPSQGSPCKHLGEKGVPGEGRSRWEDLECSGQPRGRYGSYATGDIFFLHRFHHKQWRHHHFLWFKFGQETICNLDLYIYIIPSWNSTPTETGGMYWACSFWPYDHMALAKNGTSQFRYQSNHHIPMFSWPRGVYVSHGCDAKSRWTFPQRIRASARSFGPTPAFRPSRLAALPGTSSCSLGMLLGYFGMLSWDIRERESQLSLFFVVLFLSDTWEQIKYNYAFSFCWTLWRWWWTEKKIRTSAQALQKHVPCWNH